MAMTELLSMQSNPAGAWHRRVVRPRITDADTAGSAGNPAAVSVECCYNFIISVFVTILLSVVTISLFPLVSTE